MGASSSKRFTNWNKTSVCYPSDVFYPTNEDEIRSLVLSARKRSKRIRVIGHRVHTWGDLSMCDTGDVIISFKNYNKVVAVDDEAMVVTAEAGLALEDLIPSLERPHHRLALQNMGEATEQSLGGVTATGTHGSGGGPSRRPDSFSDQVVAYKVMDLTDEAAVRTIRRDDPEFEAFMVHLGVLAVVLEVTLQLRDWFHLRWDVTDIGHVDNLKLDRMKAKYSQVYNVTYTYFPSTEQVVEIVRDYTDDTFESGIGTDAMDDFVNTLRQGNAKLLKLCPGLVEPYANVQKRALLSLTGNSDQWRKVLSQGDLWGGANFTWNHDQEYACPIDRTLEALGVIRRILKWRSSKISTAVGVRFVRGSPALLACHYSRSTDDVFAYIEVQFSVKKVDPEVPLKIQQELAKLGCRAHWGKQNATTQDLISKHSLWPRENMEKFVAVKRKYDPDNILGSAYTDRVLGLKGKRGEVFYVKNGELNREQRQHAKETVAYKGSL